MGCKIWIRCGSIREVLSAVMFGCTLMQDWPERAGSHSCSCGCRRCTPLNRRQQHEAGIAFQSISQLRAVQTCKSAPLSVTPL